MGRDFDNGDPVEFIKNLGPPMGPWIVGSGCGPRVPGTINGASAIYMELAALEENRVQHQLEDRVVLAIPGRLKRRLGQGDRAPDA